jgi:histidinol-phosphate phosphatase family protein
MVKLVCIDRDGTINEDENYYLGSSDNWKEQVRILEGVAEGIKRLNSVLGTEVFIVTNQAGVALAGEKFDALTEARMREVNDYIIGLLANEGAKVAGCFSCPFVGSSYVAKAKEKGWVVHEEYVNDDCLDIKPREGMLRKCASAIGKSLEDVDLYVIGDRGSDVQLGLNGGGKGILVCSKKTIELGDVDIVERLKENNPCRVFMAKDFLDAVRFVLGEKGV